MCGAMAGLQTTDEIRRELHALREPLGTLSLQIELFEAESLSTKGQAGVKSMRVSIERAKAVFDDLDFLLENGHPRPAADRKR
jgi:hypothetical protein